MNEIIRHHEGVMFWADQNHEPASFRLNCKSIEIAVAQVFTLKDEPELWTRIRLIGAKDQDDNEVTNADLSLPVDVARLLAKRLFELADAIDRGDIQWES